MKNKMVKYMMNREVNPIEFADLVDIGTSSSAEKRTPKNKMSKKDIGIAEIVVVFAVIIVVAFFVVMFL